MRIQSVFVVAGALAVSVSASAGVIFTEDAGDLPGTALVVDGGSGPIGAIAGTTSGPDDGVDMYMIFIDDPASFMASTEDINGGSADWDTMLWLFDAEGLGVLANDDGEYLQSTISFPNEAGDPIPAAGIYFLAISGYDDEPMSDSGYIFGSLNNSAPNGEGASDPITSWSGFDDEAGSYLIALSGVSFVPTPGAVGLFGVAGLMAIRRRGA